MSDTQPQGESPQDLRKRMRDDFYTMMTAATQSVEKQFWNVARAQLRGAILAVDALEREHGKQP